MAAGAGYAEERTPIDVTASVAPSSAMGALAGRTVSDSEVVSARRSRRSPPVAPSTDRRSPRIEGVYVGPCVSPGMHSSGLHGFMVEADGKKTFICGEILLKYVAHCGVLSPGDPVSGQPRLDRGSKSLKNSIFELRPRLAVQPRPGTLPSSSPT